MNEFNWDPILIVGFVGQAIFMSRFIVQWGVSEYKKESTVPTIFWYLSLAGGLLLLIYGILDKDPVIIAGQTPGALIYLRNIILIWQKKKGESHKE